jgi:predicted RNA-binding Zn ribbon-like protein
MSTRDIDKQDLIRSFKNAHSDKERAAIQHAGNLIRNESRKIESMREALVRARRSGNTNEVKDINYFVSKHKDYQNER